MCLGLRGPVRAVALDLRGHGDSDRTEDDSLEAHVADIGAVLDALAWPKVHLIGMSYGGLIAAHFAAAAPHRLLSLVTVDVGPGVAFEATARMRGFFQRVHPGAGVDAMVEAAMQTSPSSDRERVAYRMAAMMRRSESGDWDWARDRQRSTDYPALLAKVEEMAMAAERQQLPASWFVAAEARPFPRRPPRASRPASPTASGPRYPTPGTMCRRTIQPD